jgi:hypothetical protein
MTSATIESLARERAHNLCTDFQKGNGWGER